MSVESQQGTYNRADGPDREGNRDSANTRRIAEQQGSEAAAAHVRSELRAAETTLGNGSEYRQYVQTYLNGLRGGNGQPDILPSLAIAYGLQGGDITRNGRDHGFGEILDPTKIDDKMRAASRSGNVLDREMYRELGRKHNEIRQNNERDYNFIGGYGQPFARSGNGVVPVEQARDFQRGIDRTAENRAEMGVLATNDRLRRAIAGSDGAITKDEAKAFAEKWDRNENNFRREFTNGSRTEEEKITNALDALNRQWDSTNYAHNGINANGSILQDHLTGLGNMYGLFGFSSLTNDGVLSDQSLARGLGFRRLDDAKRNLPAFDRARGDSSSLQSPMAGVQRESNFDNTRLNGRNEGPWHVANRMLQGQEEFFRNAPGGIDKARRDLTTALGVRSGVHNSRLGANQLTEDNMSKVIENINRLDNPALRDWLISRYPGSQRLESRTEAAANYDDSRIARNGRLPSKIAENMVRGSEIADNQQAKRALQDVLRQQMRGRREGDNILRPENYDQFRRAIEAKNIEALTTWFRRRYPEPRR